ncbi:MAG: hypothetical protein KGI58_01415 [Patescibacteria group bacterium]|nr:hypothetical protein [Patescibacteria group bacterium]
METVKPVSEPVHQTCKEIVKKPTLFREKKHGNEVWLQWYGESKNFDLTGKQFHFPINADPGNFFYQPENFEIIMIGPVKKWPNKDINIVNYMIEQCGGEETIIIYFISSKFGADDGNGGIIPTAGVLPLDIKLVDDNLGIINPKEFFDDSVRIEAIKKFQD